MNAFAHILKYNFVCLCFWGRYSASWYCFQAYCVYLQVLKKFGVEKFDPTNEPFDPHRHNAVFQIPDDSKPPGTVAAVLKLDEIMNLLKKVDDNNLQQSIILKNIESSLRHTLSKVNFSFPFLFNRIQLSFSGFSFPYLTIYRLACFLLIFGSKLITVQLDLICK